MAETEKNQNMTFRINTSERALVEEAATHYRKRTGENITLGRVARDESVKWAKRELKKPMPEA